MNFCTDISIENFVDLSGESSNGTFTASRKFKNLGFNIKLFLDKALDNNFIQY